MTSKERKVFTYTNIIVSMIGMIYFILKYFFQVETEYGILPHKQTPYWLHLHIISVPFLIFLTGYLYRVHIGPKLNSGNPKRSISGVSILTSFGFMVISGYLLQIGLKDKFNVQAAWIHIITSFIWLLGYLWHFRFNFSKN